MSVTTLKTRVKKLAVDLAPHGFVFHNNFLIKRERSTLDQFIELEPGHRSFEGKFRCNIAWKFKFPEIETDTSVHILIHQNPKWYQHEPKEALEEAYLSVKQYIETRAIPFLDSIDSIEKMVRAYERAIEQPSDEPPNDDNPLFFFSRSPGWKECFLGYAYSELGEVEKAKINLRLVIEQFSDGPRDYIVKRKAACATTLANLEN